MTKRMWVLVALLTVGLAVPAAGVSKTTGGHAEHDRLGGLHPGPVGEAVREADAAARSTPSTPARPTRWWR